MGTIKYVKTLVLETYWFLALPQSLSDPCHVVEATDYSLS